MTSVTAFNDMMEQFLRELTQTFPEEKTIKKYAMSFDLVRKSNPRKCVESYMISMSPHSEHIMQKNEAFFLSNTDNVAMFKDINLPKYWNDPELSQGTKDAIWQYLQTLFILGTTITAIPAETLTMIEGVAKQCADNMQGGGGAEGGGGALDEKALMSSMTGLLSAMGGGGGGGGGDGGANPMAALLGAMGGGGGDGGANPMAALLGGLGGGEKK